MTISLRQAKVSKPHFNPSTWDAKAGFIYILSRPGLHSETLPTLMRSPQKLVNGEKVLQLWTRKATLGCGRDVCEHLCGGRKETLCCWGPVTGKMEVVEVEGLCLGPWKVLESNGKEVAQHNICAPAN